MEFSKYQREIFRAVEDDEESLTIEAVAGSGKTTTMVEAAKRVDVFGDHIAIAFNKTIATTLQQKMPSHVDARTFNSLGYRTLMKKGKFEHDNNKLLSIFKQVVPTNYHEDHLYTIRDIAMHGKAWGVGVFAPNDETTWAELIDDDRFDIPQELIPRMIDWVTKGYKRSLNDTQTMDFNDQILMPLYMGIRPAQFETIFVDEAQDLSPLQHEFLYRCLTPGGRVIAFGDSHQAIYGFRGADTDSMNNLSKKFNSSLLPLSISYRCPRKVVELAQKLVPQIESAENAIDGEVNEYEFLPPIPFFEASDLVLCRNNAPLLKLGMLFLLERKPVNVRSNFGAPLLKFVREFKTDDKEIFLKRLESWYETEASAAENEAKWGKLNRIQEKYDAIKGIAELPEVKSVDDILKALKQLLEPGRGTTLSTVHKAKGEEAERVFIYGPELIPSKFAKDDASLQQEHNLLYVAITRALSELNFVPLL